MRILFFMRTVSGYLRLFDSVLRALADRGHEIHLAVNLDDEMGRLRAEALTQEYPSISVGFAPGRGDDVWLSTGRQLRMSLDALRFLGRDFADVTGIRLRAQRRMPPIVRSISDLPGLRSEPGRRALSWVLSGLERAVPVTPGVEEFIEQHQPSVVLFTPLVNLGSTQPEYLRAARRLGLPTAVCVASWDNLSSKALIRDLPDAVLVWNEIQKKEATDFHGIPADRVIVTGAQCFDHWFNWKVSSSQDEFCQRMGLVPTDPYILFVGSALFNSGTTEADFVRDLVRRLRSSADPLLRRCGVLIRPHPKRPLEWRDVDVSGWSNVAVWRGVQSMPTDIDARAAYYDAMYHSAGVVGLNTSALIEAAIVQRPVFTVLAPEFRASQTGTRHFPYLLDGGLLRVANTLEEHLHQLREALYSESASASSRAFLESFVRPYGIDVAATPRFVDAIEDLAKTARPGPMRTPMRLLPLRMLLFAAASWRRRRTRLAR